MNNELQKTESSVGMMVMDLAEVKSQLLAIRNLMNDLMHDGIHYGKVPGCGDKPMLFKAGAELIGFTFRLRPQYQVDIQDLGNGHKNFDVNCILYHIPSGNIVGAGLGSCSTHESKYRYRNEIIGDVPEEYWKNKDQSLLGGDDYFAKKIKKHWKIVHRIVVKDIADVWNTCLKMAKKRCHGDGIQSSTAASDMFSGFSIDADEAKDESTDRQQASPQTKKQPPKRQPPKQQPQQQQSQPPQEERMSYDADIPEIEIPICPACNGPMYDNRNGERHAEKGPDFRCKDRDCKWKTNGMDLVYDDSGDNCIQSQYATCIYSYPYEDESQ